MDDRAGSAADSWTGDPVDSGAVRSRPRGFAVRAHPHDSPALWAAIGALGPDRYGVTVGHCADPRRSAADRDRALARLREDPDPAAALASVSPAECTAVCAVIDPTAATLRYSTVGEAGVTLVAPEGTATALPPSPGVMSTVTLPAAGTVLLASRDVPAATTALRESRCRTAHPEVVADHLIAAAESAVNPGLAIIVYRQPPAPLSVTVPADPHNLTLLRARLRAWLALAGIDTEASADTLLAVGEATSNASEHAVAAAAGPVEMTVRAAVTGTALRFAVSDTGRWKPQSVTKDHRGHGIKLMNALADAAHLTTNENGTTVEMLKELPG